MTQVDLILKLLTFRDWSYKTSSQNTLYTTRLRQIISNSIICQRTAVYFLHRMYQKKCLPITFVDRHFLKSNFDFHFEQSLQNHLEQQSCHSRQSYQTMINKGFYAFTNTSLLRISMSHLVVYRRVAQHIHTTLVVVFFC